MKYRKVGLKCVYVISFALLVLYSLRHVRAGIDLWDGGYNYANFRYHGLAYMDSMWFFATWLANAAGSVLMRFPGGQSMLGMNVYTGLLIGMTAAFAYGFCVRRLQLPAWVAFVGELTALSLCWAPSAALYHYLTYVFLLAGTVSLYQGLTLEKKKYLVLAGVLLGLNVGVRLSNLVQAGLILALWYYAVITGKKVSAALKETGICILGYLGGCAFFLTWIAFRYGLDGYAEGILRLFQMTEQAQDYQMVSMLAGVAEEYYKATYWLKRFLLAAICATVGCAAFHGRGGKAKRCLTVGVCAALLWWLCRQNYGQRDYRAYGSVYAPCVVVFEFAVLLALWWMASREIAKERRLLAALTLLTLLIASLGNNNAIFTGINNGFLVMPCFLGMVYEFCRRKKALWYFPWKAVTLLAAVFLVCQAFGFGLFFVYEEAGGARDVSARVTGIPALEGMYTGAEKAEALEGLYGYLQGSGLGQQSCILYGNIPGIAYYMELVPATNIWGDLRSYGVENMREDIAGAEERLAEEGERPVIILESRYAGYAEGGSAEGLFDAVSTEEKMRLLCAFMKKHGYARVYENEKFVVYR